MLKNYIKIAFRNLLKYRTYSVINILGLTVGMISTLLILLFIQFELSFDRFHENSDRIWRVSREWFNSDGSSNLHLGFVAPPIAPLLKNDFPQIEQAVRIYALGRPAFKYQGKTFLENRYLAADPDFFNVFSFPLIKGNAETALSEPANIVITESMAHKFFGNEEPLDKVLTLPVSPEMNIDLKVAAVINDIPQNSHFHFDILGSMKGLEQFYGENAFKDWSSNNYATYLLFEKGYEAERFAKEIPGFLTKHLGENANQWNSLHLWKLTDIHLKSHLDSEFESNGNIVYVYILSAIAVLLLAIAGINFMNLATARSASRAKEIGVRKVIGARRVQIVRQFLTESVIISVLSLIFSIILINFLLPVFSDFVNVKLEFNPLKNPEILLSLIGVALFVGLVAGSYPAFFLSKFEPSAALKSKVNISSGKSLLRCGLVIFQFTITIILLSSLGVVHRQMDYCKNKELGLNKNHMLILPATDKMIQNYESFRQRLLQHTNIIGVAASKRTPSAGLLDCNQARIYDNQNSRPLDFRVANVRVSHDFIETYEIPMAAGRNFSTGHQTDVTEAFIINECAVKQIGWTSPEAAIGKSFAYGDRQGYIIGVVKDFHYESLHKAITPIVMYIDPGSLGSITIKTKPTNAQQMTSTLAFLEEIWAEYNPDEPFHYSFLDERYEQLYRAEMKLEHIFTIFSSIAIFIACLGLFGLVTFMAEKKTKEIGIRKAVGASVSQILLLLTKNFTKWIFLANLIAWPIAYWAMNEWLQNFAYRIEMSWWMFALAGGIALVIALLTVSWQAIRAATANPVESLRYE